MVKGARNQRELEAAILSQLKVVLEEQVADTIKEEQSEMVHKVVYARYTPNTKNNEPYQYVRRKDDGGLSDTRNMSHETRLTGRYSVELQVVNETTGVDLEGNPTNKTIAETVEKGQTKIGQGTYDNPRPPYASPRPFTLATMEELKSTGKLAEVFKRGMRYRGFDIY